METWVTLAETALSYDGRQAALAAVAAARKAFDEGPWPHTSPAERIAVVEAFSGLYAARLGEMADLITTEMGAPTSFSNLAQSPAPWMQIEAFLAIAREFPWEASRPGALGSDVVVRHEPVGVVAAIPPWNVPQFTVLSKVIPALLTGCTIVVKPAPETPLDCYLLAELLVEAGVPEGVVSIVAASAPAGTPTGTRDVEVVGCEERPRRSNRWPVASPPIHTARIAMSAA